MSINGLRWPAAVIVLLTSGLGAGRAKAQGPAPPGRKLDWYRWADVTARPPMLGMASLCDGDGTTTPSAAFLRRFGISLAPGEVKLVRVKPAE